MGSWAGPVPGEWVDEGVPAGPLAAFAEGACPVHLVLLEAGVIRHGGKGGLPEVRLAAGWCEACGCWWHRAEAGGLAATWRPGGGKAEAAGWAS